MRNIRGGSASFLLGAAAPSASIRRPLTGRSSFPPTPTAGKSPQRPYGKAKIKIVFWTFKVYNWNEIYFFAIILLILDTRGQK